MSKSSPQWQSQAGIGGEPPQRDIATGGPRGATGWLTARHVRFVLLAVLVATALAYLLRPIMDPDFFWHLKTGEWIREHRGLPASDPFSYTNAGIDTRPPASP